jgi:DNA-binding response OmpR family regulator
VWILVVGRRDMHDRPDGGVAVLRDMGCRVRAADLWDGLDEDAELAQRPPACVLIEALDQVDAGRAALLRLRSVPALMEVPCLVAVSVGALPRLDPQDGFDDFVLVPYVPAELYVRVRRAEWRKSEFENGDRLKVGSLVIDLAGHEVSVDGRPVELTHQEFALLRFLAQHRGRVFSREQLLQRVWGVDYYGGSRTVDIHVRRLRMKLGAAAAPLETVRGAGYKMKAP